MASNLTGSFFILYVISQLFHIVLSFSPSGLIITRVPNFRSLTITPPTNNAVLIISVNLFSAFFVPSSFICFNGRLIKTYPDVFLSSVQSRWMVFSPRCISCGSRTLTSVCESCDKLHSKSYLHSKLLSTSNGSRQIYSNKYLSVIGPVRSVENSWARHDFTST